MLLLCHESQILDREQLVDIGKRNRAVSEVLTHRNRREDPQVYNSLFDITGVHFNECARVRLLSEVATQQIDSF